MKTLLLIMALLVPTMAISETLVTSSTPITALTVGELQVMIQKIINDTLERCVVEGIMEGKSSITLRVVGDVRANIKCL